VLQSLTVAAAAVSGYTQSVIEQLSVEFVLENCQRTVGCLQ